MICCETIVDIKQHVQAWKSQQKTIAFVPTMGNLHQGHLSLVEKAKTLADKVVVSIFVNPMQFGAGEDLENYPRTLTEDSELLTDLNVDLLFLPNNGVMYPPNLGRSTEVFVPEISKTLCGQFRPDHFLGVTTVVNKLFNIVEANVAVFGEKDFQQVFIIKKMVDDLFMPIEIISSATVRESDGLAMSSRNQYLSSEQRQQAALIYQVLQELKDLALAGSDLRQLESQGIEKLLVAGFKVDYVSFRSRKDLQPAKNNDREIVLLVAAWMGETRLIDNLKLSLVKK